MTNTNVPLMFFFGFLAVVLVVVMVSAYLYYFRLWLGAFAAGVSVPLPTLFGMTFRRVSAAVVVRGYITAHKNGIQLSLEELEAHYLEGGNVREVTEALVLAKKASHPLSFEEACTVDLQGKSPVEHARALAGTP